MSDVSRREMQGLLVRMKSVGATQRGIAAASGVRQPLVSLAAKGKLVAKTGNVEKLFEYLRAESVALRASEPEPVPVRREPDPRILEALARLSDGSEIGDERLLGLLEAIASLRPGDDAERG